MGKKLVRILRLPDVGQCVIATFIPCGEWRANKHYAYSSLVKQGDATYICINPDGSSASPQDLFISFNNQILQLQDGNYLVASGDVHPDWQELCRDGVPGTAVDCATADANGLMSSEDYSRLRDLLVSNESLLTQTTELQTLYNQLLDKVDNLPTATADANGLMSSKDYSSLQALLVSNESLLTQTEELQTLYNQLLARLDAMPAIPAVNNAKTEFRLGSESDYAFIGSVTANQSDELIIYIPYASKDKHGVLNKTDYTSLMEMLNAHPALVSEIASLTNTVSNCATKAEIPYVGNGKLHLKVNGTEITPEGGLFSANKGDDSTINIAVPTAESVEKSTMDKINEKVVFKDTFASELAKEFSEVLSEKNTDKGLVFKFDKPFDNPANLECNPDILSFNYIKVGDIYRLNITGSFVLNGFNFNAQRGQNNYNPVLYKVKSGSINNSDLFTEKTGMLYLRLSDQQASTEEARGPVVFELSVFVKSLSSEGYSNGIYGQLDITQFYSE